MRQYFKVILTVAVFNNFDSGANSNVIVFIIKKLLLGLLIERIPISNSKIFDLRLKFFNYDGFNDDNHNDLGIRYNKCGAKLCSGAKLGCRKSSVGFLCIPILSITL